MERHVNRSIPSPSPSPSPIPSLSVEAELKDSPHNMAISSLVRSSTDTQAVPTDHTFTLPERHGDISDSPAELSVDSVLRESTAHHSVVTYPDLIVQEDTSEIEKWPSSSDSETVYIDHTIATFDETGGMCSLDGCTLTIPQGAIPKDEVIAIRIGVSICTPLTSLLPLGVRPVSPVVQLCTLDQPHFKFSKPVTIKIQHFLDIAREEDVKTMNLHFLKSSHNLYCFHTTDGLEVFMPHTHHGTLKINHFCSFCIAAEKSSVDASSVYYYLMSVIPKQVLTHKWDVIFCVALYTCSRVILVLYRAVIIELTTGSGEAVQSGHI